MADSKISALTAYLAASLLGIDLLPIVDMTNGATKKVALTDLIQQGLWKVLNANDTGGQNVATVQPWFPTAGGVTVTSGTTYAFTGKLRTSRAAGTTSHTTSLLFGGTAVLASIAYKAICNTGDTVANIASNQIAVEVATAVVVKAASTSATEQIDIFVTGIVRVTTGGTFIPQFQYSAIPGGTPTILANSFFQLVPLGNSTVQNQGTWA